MGAQRDVIEQAVEKVQQDVNNAFDLFKKALRIVGGGTPSARAEKPKPQKVQIEVRQLPQQAGERKAIAATAQGGKGR